MTTAQAWTLVGTVVALWAALVTVIIAFMASGFAAVDNRFAPCTGASTRWTVLSSTSTPASSRSIGGFEQFDGRFEQVDRRSERMDSRSDDLDRDIQAIARHVFGDCAAPS